MLLAQNELAFERCMTGGAMASTPDSMRCTTAQTPGTTLEVCRKREKGMPLSFLTGRERSYLACDVGVQRGRGATARPKTRNAVYVCDQLSQWRFSVVAKSWTAEKNNVG